MTGWANSDMPSRAARDATQRGPLTCFARAWDRSMRLGLRRTALYRLVLSLVGLGMLPLLASAADAGSDCVGIDDDRARLACYDELHGRVAPIGANVATAALPAASQGRVVGESPTEIVATVVAVQAHSHVGRWIVTLDNGQVWEQRETTPEARRPRVGDKVTIREAAFGSYLLQAPNRGSNRVKRVR